MLAMGAAMAWALRATGESPRHFFTIRPFGPTLLSAIVTTTLGLALVLSETDNIIGDLLRLRPGFQDYSRLFKLREYPLGAFLLLVVIAPLTEEYLFRGLILRGLLTRHSRAAAVWLTAPLFGLVHANLPQLFLGVVVGAVFGWWYVRTGRSAHASSGTPCSTAWPASRSCIPIHFQPRASPSPWPAGGAPSVVAHGRGPRAVRDRSRVVQIRH